MLQERSVLKPGAAQEPGQQPGRYCIHLSRVFTSAVNSKMLCLVRLASDRFSLDPPSILIGFASP
jgi:hypothetical protein